MNVVVFPFNLKFVTKDPVVCVKMCNMNVIVNLYKKGWALTEKREINFVHLTINFSIFAVTIIFY